MSEPNRLLFPFPWKDKDSSITLVGDRPQTSDANQHGAPEILFMPCGHSTNGRNLIVCIDGTSNQFGEKNTNVIELYNLIFKEIEHNQRTWYNSGIGTYARPSWRSFKFYKQVLSHKVDLAIAWDFERTVLGAYRWLADNYQKGDRIFLFGFSRGAYQVRVLSAMIDKVGLIHKGNEMQIPFAYELYADPKSDAKTANQVGSQKEMSMADRFKDVFCHKDVKVHFVGVWDTVSSIGVMRGKHVLPRTVDGMGHVCYFRHALALDERRVKFLPEYASENPNRKSSGEASSDIKPSSDCQPSETSSQEGDFEMSSKARDAEFAARKGMRTSKERPHTLEVWFAGTHSDIGGGNVYNTGLDRSRPPLRWMVTEAASAGLRTAPFDRELLLEEQIEIKESLTWVWWPFEFFPFQRLTFTRNNGRKITHKPHLGASRKIHAGQKIHSSLLVGKVNAPYTPKARPPIADDSFWKNLPRGWLELDLYEYTGDLMENYVRRSGSEISKKLVYQTLVQIVSSGDGRQAIYDKVVEMLSDENLGHGEHVLHARIQVMRLALEILKNQNLILRPSVEMRPFTIDSRPHTIAYELHIELAQGFVRFLTDPLICSLRGPKSKLISVGLLSNPDQIYSAWHDDGVRVWDTKTGKQLQVIHEHQGSIQAAKCSPDGKYVALILRGRNSSEHSIQIWDLTSGDPMGMPFRCHGEYFSCCTFSPDGRLLISASSEGTIRSWDVETQKELGRPLRSAACVKSLSFDASGTFVAAGSENGTIQLWNVEKGKQIGDSLEGHSGPVVSAKFSADGKHIISGSMDGTIRIWEVEKGKTVGGPLDIHASGVNDATFSPDGKYFVSASDMAIRAWNTKTLEAVGDPLRGHQSTILSIEFSRDGERLVSGSEDGTIKIWDILALERLML